MRALVTPRRRLVELAPPNDRIYRAKLAEDYDGIGQYVMVALAGSSVGSAYKARIAAGDFGGGRTFPAGTPVHVFSYRGQLEVFLGNLPRGCDLFNRETDEPNGGWGSGPYGPWLTIPEMMEVPDPDSVEDGWVEGGMGIMRYSHDPSIDPAMGLRLPDEATLPIKVEFTRDIIGYFGDANIQIYFGAWHFLSYDSWLVWTQSYSTGGVLGSRVELFNSVSGDGIFDWPGLSDDGPGFVTMQESLEAAAQPLTIQVEIDEVGTRGKFWHPLTQSEPDDWQVKATWEFPPAMTLLRHLYIESQNFHNPPATEIQPLARIDNFCLSYG